LNHTDCLDGGYKPIFTDKLQLEEALLFTKTTLEDNLKANLNLVRVSAPLFVTRASGFNDNLNGVERPATFEPRDFPGIHLEVREMITSLSELVVCTMYVARVGSNAVQTPRYHSP
jgi:aspartate--ammonia ligase